MSSHITQPSPKASNDDLVWEEAFAQKRMNAENFWRLPSYVKPCQRIFILNLALTLLRPWRNLLATKVHDSHKRWGMKLSENLKDRSGRR